MMVLNFETDHSNGFSHLFVQISQHSQSDICIDNLIKCELSPDRETVSKNITGFSQKIMANAQFFWKPSRVSQMHSWTSLHFSVNQSLFSEDLVEVRLLILMSFAVKKWSGKTTEKYSKSKSSALCYLLWIYIKSEK